MKNRVSREMSLFAIAMVTGTLITLSLLISIMLLASYRPSHYEPKALLVVDLTQWPSPTKHPKSLDKKKKFEPEPPKPKPKSKTKPVPKQANPKEVPPTQKKSLPVEEAVAAVKAVVEEMPRQDVPVETSPTIKNRLPTPVPIFRLTQVPRFLHKENPVYPPLMRASGKHGVVKLEVLIDKDGRVRKVSILKSAGNYFDDAAKQAILGSSFYPAKVDRKPVAVLLRLPVRFDLL